MKRSSLHKQPLVVQYIHRRAFFQWATSHPDGTKWNQLRGGSRVARAIYRMGMLVSTPAWKRLDEACLADYRAWEREEESRRAAVRREIFDRNFPGARYEVFPRIIKINSGGVVRDMLIGNEDSLYRRMNELQPDDLKLLQDVMVCTYAPPERSPYQATRWKHQYAREIELEIERNRKSWERRPKGENVEQP